MPSFKTTMQKLSELETSCSASLRKFDYSSASRYSNLRNSAPLVSAHITSSNRGFLQTIVNLAPSGKDCNQSDC
jgi:hypothetical protein